MTAVAAATMLPRTVGTFEIVNVPPGPVVVVWSKTVTVAPATPALLASTTVPITVVIGSGATRIVTSGATPTLPPRSVARALSVRLVMPDGTVSGIANGCDVSTNGFCPFTRNSTDATATSSVALAVTDSGVPSMTVAPSAGDEMVTVGGTPARSCCEMY